MKSPTVFLRIATSFQCNRLFGSFDKVFSLYFSIEFQLLCVSNQHHCYRVETKPTGAYKPSTSGGSLLLIRRFDEMSSSKLAFISGYRYSHLHCGNPIAYAFPRFFSSSVVHSNFLFDSRSGFLR